MPSPAFTSRIVNTRHPLLAGLILALGLSTCFRSEAAASLPTVSPGTERAHECVSEAKENAERNPGCAAHAEAAPSATRARRFLQLDVFSGHPGSGNPLAVILDSEGLDTAGMQALAAWLNLSETIFFVPVTDGAADYHIRIFTPRSELPFAGHPSVGAAWAAVHTGRAAPRNGTLVQQCGAGLLPVAVEESNGQRSITVRSPPARQLEVAQPELPAALADIAAPGTEPSQWSNGSTWWLMEAGDEAALRALRPDSNVIVEQLPGGKIAAYAFSKGPEYQMTTRAFAPGVGVAEDPVNGNANAMIAAHLHRQGRLPGQEGRYIVSQGRELGRDGKIMVRVDAEGEVWIGGQVQSVIEGILHW